MNTAGAVLLALAALSSAAGVVLPLLGRVLHRDALARMACWALGAVLAFAAAAAGVLLAALLTRDFGNAYVYEHSSRGLSTAYTVTALWAGNAGSLLLWLLLMSLFSVIAARGRRKLGPRSAAYLMAILGSIGLFFSLLMLLGPSCDPFAANSIAPAPQDGLGLNPMLQNLGMVIHPLTLYLGYVALAVPFGLAIAGLAGGSALSTWIVPVRRWALVGWLFLTLGNVVGAWWAYVTLGWGGYWAWDPVENASLIPWLTATALLHSAFVAQRRGRQQVWTVGLAAGSFLLTIFGTFLTRTGVANSVHAFTESRLIAWFVIYLVLMFALAVGVMIWRRRMLTASGEVGSALAESSNVLYAVVLLTALTALILWGVIFPPIAQSVTGTEFVLGTAFFDTVAAPLGLVLLFLLAVCSLAGLSKGSRRRSIWTLAAACGTGLAVLAVLLAVGVRKGYPVAAFALAGAAAVAVLARWIWGWRARRGHGALVAHLGVLILVIGLAGSWSFKESTEGRLVQGQSLTLHNVTVTYQELQSESDMAGEREIDRAILGLTLDGKESGRLTPTVEYYPLTDQTWTRVARRTSAAGDVYVSLLAVDGDGQIVDIKLESHPLIVWLWVGGGVMSAGSLLALWALRGRSREARGS